MKEQEQFLGKEGFIWWTGIVEDRQDPLRLGRCRVRCVGWHPNDKIRVPTANLPWAQLMLPTNNPHPYPPKEGDMVFGFFLDGDSGQDPVILGVFPSIPLQEPNPQEAFNDPRTQEELNIAPIKPTGAPYDDDGKPTKVVPANATANNYPRNLDEPTTSRLARNETANTESAVLFKLGRIEANNTSSVEPVPSYNATYPYNKVYESESGHVMEFDDTRDNERIHLYHRAGSYMEFNPNGDRVERIQRDKFTVVVKDESVLIQGDVNIQVDGDYNLNVTGDVKINGQTINLNNGSQGAARIGDTVADVDPVGDGTISSGSGTVKIGG